MRHVTLYTKPGCHLCEAAEALLGRLAAEVPLAVTAVNIAEDEALLARYSERIPVVRVGEVELAAPLSEFKLRRALARGMV
ncbi:MAG: glutaredoxin family protein [Anaerolineae bacterium]|nr:glutaredoxin family protein [Anaerolineae bacterium]